MKTEIDRQQYSGLEGMYYLSGEGLKLIDLDGTCTADVEFNTEFLPQIDDIISINNISPDHDDVIGWFIPHDNDEYNPQWQNCTLKLTAETFDQLSAFEIALDEHIEKLGIMPKLPIQRAMSAYEGMRKLTVYGLVLGFIPIVSVDDSGSPVVIRLNEEELPADVHVALKDRIMDSHLFEGCTIKPVIESLLDSTAKNRS